jgi:hypothetical protein
MSTTALAHDPRVDAASLGSLAPVVRITELDTATADGDGVFVVLDAGCDVPADAAARLWDLAERTRVTVFSSPACAPLLDVLLGVEGDEPVLEADPVNPLVASPVSHLRGVDGLDGLTLTVIDAVSLRAVGSTTVHPLAVTPAGDVVVGRVARAEVVITVVGSTSPLGDRLLGSRDNLAFLTWLATGSVDLARAGRIAAQRAPRRAHSSAPVVVVDEIAPLPLPDAPVGDPAFVRAAGHARRLLPPAVHDALIDFADAPPVAGALLLRGLPVGELPPTPAHPTAPTVKDSSSVLNLLMV